MENAILKTLIYADIFDYPLKTWKIHKWLIGRKVSLIQVERALIRLSLESRVKSLGDYYFLPKRHGLVAKRMRRERQSQKYLRKASFIAWILKLIPWIKLVGVSGGLAMGNADKKDDIDLFIITAKNRLWISRIFALGLLSLIGQRRKVSDMGVKIAGKICVNTLLEEDRLEQNNKDIYLAHEILQMRPLWYRDGIYEKYLQDNQWVFKYVPNWVGPPTQNSKLKTSMLPSAEKNYNSNLKTFDLVEALAKWLQLKVMKKPQGLERIEDGALYFHPQDYRRKILNLYQKRVKKLRLS